MLNLHEWWLLRSVRVSRADQHDLLIALTETGQTHGDIDFLAEVGGYTLVKRSVPKDLESLFDRLMNPCEIPGHGVAYGNRRGDILSW
jgi:hypothetical protein